MENYEHTAIDGYSYYSAMRLKQPNLSENVYLLRSMGGLTWLPFRLAEDICKTSLLRLGPVDYIAPLNLPTKAAKSG